MTETALRGLKLSRGVEIEEVSVAGQGKVRRGEAAVVLTPAGGPPFAVTLASGHRKALISYNPYTGRVIVSYPSGKGMDG